MVLHQDADADVKVKLIDIDNLEEQLRIPEGPAIGSDLYLAPEARSGEAYYDCEQADSYAMGICLRQILGASDSELTQLQIAQRLRAVFERSHDAWDGQSRYDFECNLHAHLGNSINDLNMVKLTPQSTEAWSLLEVSDLLLQHQVAHRISAKEILNQGFFQNGLNFLGDREFSRVSNLLVRFGNAVS